MIQLVVRYLKYFMLGSILFLAACEEKVQEKENEAPTVTITATDTSQYYEMGDTISIQVNASDNDGEIQSITLTIDNKEIVKVNTSSLTYEWITKGEQIGNHRITAVAEDSENETVRESMYVYLNEKIIAPIASFTVSDSNIHPADEIKFEDNSQNKPVKWIWEFGDGRVDSSGYYVYHTYNAIGTYTVTLTVRNSAGSNTVTKSDLIVVKSEIKDSDNNTYRTVKMGIRWWMAENLATTTLNDGTPIEYGPVIEDGSVYDKPAYLWYNHEKETYKNPYGAMYNWIAVSTEKLCPAGWHVPTLQEYMSLWNFAGDDAAGKLKVVGTDYWKSPNTGATDAFGFSVYPAGLARSDGKTFLALGEHTYLWTKSTAGQGKILIFFKYDQSDFITSSGGSGYLPLRCIKDN